jgi:hypothetical protein
MALAVMAMMGTWVPVLSRSGGWRRWPQAVHAGHVHIHEDGVERLALEEVDGLLAVGGQRDKVAAFFEHAGADELVDMAVLDDSTFMEAWAVMTGSARGDRWA